MNKKPTCKRCYGKLRCPRCDGAKGGRKAKHQITAEQRKRMNDGIKKYWESKRA